ncbi:MAG: GntR family transcriptional regulator [Negativicutes bacterium]|nr:GntR family transcriptional regulator [Negativicutes bacterium]
MNSPLPFSQLTAVKARTLSEQVYEQLKAGILQGTIAPDTKLNETEVAQWLNVSPTPVREAFRRLATEGLVASTPWRGVSVRRVSEKEYLESYQCREVLEGLACRLAAEHMDKVGIRRLRQVLQKSIATTVATEVVTLNTELHNIIFEYAGNAKLKALLGLFHEMILRNRTLTAYNEIRRHEINCEHESIIVALEGHDADQAEAVMRTHVLNGMAYRKKYGRKEED